GHFGPVIQIPLHARGELRDLLQQFRLERLYGKEGNQSNHGADFQRDLAAAGRAEFVVIKLVLFIPQPHAVLLRVDGGGDAQKVFEELGRDVFVGVIVERQLERDAQQVEAVHRHPTGAVRLVDEAAGGQRRAAVEHPDVVQTEETALKNVPALRVLAVDPPGEVEHQLVENAFQKSEIARVRRIRFPTLLAV